VAGNVGKTFLIAAKHTIKVMAEVTTMITFSSSAPFSGFALRVISRRGVDDRRIKTLRMC